ncbi:GntR family transcriptional regulator [Ktedonosporobacter rubrisoli]|uniref:GntR family transcriptional regulator n=1 Tax=Ktedonosporobacter rubrisoli TaxID=2509675 RepID=A0A4P6K3A8_KTERU|nr:GntR family transcriptional regulator [Ktedonosporobacter rubrisoli]QBD82525.1 GntR family transcriptional regulator [Ktedonosporobacter rubrisoli]
MDIDTLVATARQHYRTTPAMVADVLREAILSGALKGGQSLRQDEIAAKFGLSRIPVREALRQLEGEGLVTFYPHRGAVVSELSLEELQEICEIRVALETLAIRLAIPRLNEEVLQRAEEILDSLDAEGDVLRHWSEVNWRFHSTLYTVAQRPRLLSMIKLLHTQIDRYLRIHVSLLNYRTKGEQEHRQILEACRQRDAERATSLLEQHIKTVEEMLATYLQQGQENHKSAGLEV